MPVVQLDVPSMINLLHQLGRGSYGSVYAATFNGQSAAVKAVPLEPNSDGAALANELQTEIKMLKKCDSEWIVQYLGCVRTAGLERVNHPPRRCQRGRRCRQRGALALKQGRVSSPVD